MIEKNDSKFLGNTTILYKSITLEEENELNRKTSK